MNVKMEETQDNFGQEACCDYCSVYGCNKHEIIDVQQIGHYLKSELLTVPQDILFCLRMIFSYSLLSSFVCKHYRITKCKAGLFVKYNPSKPWASTLFAPFIDKQMQQFSATFRSYQKERIRPILNKLIPSLQAECFEEIFKN